MKAEEREDVLRRFEAMGWPEMAETIRGLQSKKAGLQDQIKNINERLKVMCIDVIPDKMAQDGLRGVPLADGGRIELRSKAYCSVRAGQKPALESWLVEIDAEDLIQPTVNASTLKAFVKERLDRGDEIPEEIINYQPFVEATLIKGK
jgi:hypothetical protein